MALENLVTGKFGTSTILHQDNLAPQFIDIYWTFIANCNYTLPNLEHDSTRLFWPTIGMSVSNSLCPRPLRAKGEFYPILSQITTMNHDDDIFLHCNQRLVNNESNVCDTKLFGAKLSVLNRWCQIVWCGNVWCQFI